MFTLGLIHIHPRFVIYFDVINCFCALGFHILNFFFINRQDPFFFFNEYCRIAQIFFITKYSCRIFLVILMSTYASILLYVIFESFFIRLDAALIASDTTIDFARTSLNSYMNLLRLDSVNNR